MSRRRFTKPNYRAWCPPDTADAAKAELLIDFEDRLAVFDCLILCRFYRDMYSWEELAEVMRLVTRLDSTVEDLKVLAGRVADMTRTFNLREGMSPADDRLPDRLHESLPSGDGFSRGGLKAMLDGYYKRRGWNC